MDNFTKVSFIPQKNKHLLNFKIIVLFSIIELKVSTVRLVKTSSKPNNLILLNNFCNSYHYHIPYLLLKFKPLNSSLINYLNSNNVSTKSTLLHNLITVYKLSLPLKEFNISSKSTGKPKRLKLYNKSSINLLPASNVTSNKLKKRVSRRRGGFEKNKRSRHTKLLIKKLFIRKLNDVNVFNSYRILQNCNINLSSKLDPNYRGRFILGNDKSTLRKPRLTAELKLFKKHSWSKALPVPYIDNLVFNKLYNFKSLTRIRSISSNLNILDLLGFNNWVCDTNSILINNSKINTHHNKKSHLNYLSFLSRFLTNPSDSFLRKLPLNKIYTKNNKYIRSNQKVNISVSYKRVIIFFISSLLSNLSSLSVRNKHMVVRKLIKSSIFNSIINIKKVKFNSNNLIFNMFIRNYLSSKWESKKLKKKNRNKKIFFKLKKIALYLSKTIYPIYNTDSKPNKLGANMSRFKHRFLFRYILNFLLNRFYIRVKYKKLRFLKWNLINSKKFSSINNDCLDNKLLNDDIQLIISNIYKDVNLSKIHINKTMLRFKNIIPSNCTFKTPSNYNNLTTINNFKQLYFNNLIEMSYKPVSKKRANSLKDDRVQPTTLLDKLVTKSSRLKFVKLISFSKRLKAKKSKKINNSSLSSLYKKLNLDKVVKYSNNSYKLKYLGFVTKKKLKVSYSIDKPKKYVKKKFKKIYRKKKLLIKRKFPIFNLINLNNVSNRKLFFFDLKNNNNTYYKLRYLNKKASSNLRHKSLKKFFIKKKKNINFINLLYSNNQLDKTYSNSLIRRSNPLNSPKISSSKVTYLKDLFLRLPNRQVINELTKLIKYNNKGSSSSSNSLYSDLLYKNISTSSSNRNLDSLTKFNIKSSTKLPDRVIKRLLLPKGRPMPLFKRRSLTIHHTKQLLNSRWSFKVSRLKKLAIINAKLSNLSYNNPLTKKVKKSYKNNLIKKRISKLIKLVTRKKNTILNTLSSKYIYKNLSKCYKIIKKNLNKKVLIKKKPIKYKFVKKSLLKRFFTKSKHLRPINLNKLRTNLVTSSKKDLSQFTKAKLNTLSFKLPKYLKNTKLLSKLLKKKLIRGNYSFRAATLSKSFFRFRKPKKKIMQKKKGVRIKIPLVIKNQSALIVPRRFKKLNTNFMKYFLKNRIKKKNKRIRYVSLSVLNGPNINSRNINYNRIKSNALKSLIKCPFKIKNKTKRKYFIDSLKTSSILEKKKHTTFQSASYKLIKPFKKNPSWYDNSVLKRKLKKIKLTFLKSKKSPIVSFYTLFNNNKRLLNLLTIKNLKNNKLINNNNWFVKAKKSNYFFKKNRLSIKSPLNQLNRLSINSWYKNILLRNKIKKNTTLEKNNYNLLFNVKKKKNKKSNTYHIRFKRLSKSIVFKKLTNRILKNKLKRSFFRKFAIKDSIASLSKYYNVYKLKGTGIRHTSHANKHNLSKYVISNALITFNELVTFNPLINHLKSNNHLINFYNTSPLSLSNRITNCKKTNIEFKPYNYDTITIDKNYIITNISDLISPNYVKISLNAECFFNIQSLPSLLSSSVDLIKVNYNHVIKTNLTNFIFKYLYLFDKLKEPKMYNLSYVKSLFNNMNQIVSDYTPYKNYLGNINKTKVNSNSYSSLRFNSYNHLINLISNQVYNNNLTFISIDLLKYSLNSSYSLNIMSSSIANNLRFEFNKISPTFFIDETISLILTSVRFKDTNLFLTWFTRFMNKLPIKKHKRAIAFLTKLFKIIYFSNFKKLLKSSGIYFDIRGKVGVTGSKKKRHNSITLGKYSNTNRSLRLVTQKSVVVTSTGVLGVTFSVFY